MTTNRTDAASDSGAVRGAVSGAAIPPVPAERWLLAHAKSDSAEQRTLWIAEIVEAFEDAGRHVEVVLAADDFRERFHAYGAWPEWCGSLSQGGRYAGIIVPVPAAQVGFATVIVGKGTFGIAQHALRAGCHLYLWDGAFRRVTHARARPGKPSWTEFGYLHATPAHATEE